MDLVLTKPIRYRQLAEIFSAGGWLDAYRARRDAESLL
jgi:hypothetical protein